MLGSSLISMWPAFGSLALSWSVDCVVSLHADSTNDSLPGTHLRGGSLVDPGGVGCLPLFLVTIVNPPSAWSYCGAYAPSVSWMHSVYISNTIRLTCIPSK